MVNKFKEGDLVTVVRHPRDCPFNVGDEVRVVYLDSGTGVYTYYCQQGAMGFWMAESELALSEDCTEEAAIPVHTEEVSSSVDMVNHPPHYTSHPSGVEVIEITEWMNFCLGNAVKYIMRADLKFDAIEDLKKAVWYVNREIDRRDREVRK